MSQKSWEARVTALALEAAAGLRALAPRREGDREKTRIDRAALATGFSYWRAFDIWYRKARVIRAEEIDAIRAAKATRHQERANELASVAADFEALAERVARLAAGPDRTVADRMRILAVRTRRLAEGE